MGKDTDIPHLLNEYTKLILAIVNDLDEDPLWLRFYQIQMTMFLLSKKNFEFCVDEAEDAYDKIVRTWTDLKSYLGETHFPVKNYDNLFKNVVVPFSYNDCLFCEQ